MTGKPTGTWYFAALDARARARPPIIAGPPRPSGEGLHRYARHVVDAELGRLDACHAAPLGQAPAWDTTTYEVACNLLEIANSPWSGYSIGQARADLDARAPRDRGFTDKRVDAKWRSAEQKIGGAGRPEPTDHGGPVTVLDDGKSTPAAPEDDILTCVACRSSWASRWLGAMCAHCGQPGRPSQQPTVPEQAADTEGEPYPRSWLPVPLDAVLDGTWRAPEATVGARTDGVGLFYPGKSHVIVSETEAGKTWLLLAACLDEMGRGKHVLYADFEDDQGGIVGRLLTMGCHRDTIRENFHYIRPSARLTGSDLDDFTRTLEEHAPSLVVVDGTTEAMALHGLDPNKNDDAAAFGRMLPTRITTTGAACVSADHVTKDRENRGRWAIGAQHKLAALDGAQYVLENRTPFGIGLTGRSTIKIAKDRPAQLRKQALPSSGGMFWFGDLVVQSHAEDFAEVSIEPPAERDEDFRPTVLMGRIADALTAHGPLAQRRICVAVKGKAVTIRAALDCLILDGYVSADTPHALLKPYRPEGS